MNFTSSTLNALLFPSDASSTKKPALLISTSSGEEGRALTRFAFSDRFQVPWRFVDWSISRHRRGNRRPWLRSEWLFFYFLFSGQWVGPFFFFVPAPPSPPG